MFSKLAKMSLFIYAFAFASLSVQANSSTSSPGFCANDWKCVFEVALIPLESGYNDQLVDQVAFAELPALVHDSVLRATKTIEGRRFEGTDFRAWVEDFLVIYRSPAKKVPIAYAVVGRGTGEPDYNEEIYYGFAVNGDQVYHNIEDY